MARRAARGLATGLALAAAALSVTWGSLFYRPLPTIDGYYRFLGLHERAEVLRDLAGTPHVSAADAHDLFFLQGYVTAQDRLAQMEALRSSARAGFGDVARVAAGHATPALREALEAYAAGITKLISQDAAAGALPGELVLAGRRPAPWEPADTLAIAAAYLEHALPTSVCASASAARAFKGRPLLAADVYLDDATGGWYEIGLAGGPLRAIGVALPGVPGIAAGHNGWVAWALLSSARPGPDPAGTLAGLLAAMEARGAASFADAMRGSAVAACIADIAGRIGGSDRALVAFVAADRPAVLGGDGGRGAAIADALERARGVDPETMRLLLGRPPGGVAGARVIVDLADVDTSKAALSKGISGHRASPHVDDQAALWEIGQVHRMPFSRAAIGRIEGQLVLRAR